MIKRLTLSVMLLAMAAFAMTGAATAYFADSETAAVDITTGTAALEVGVDVNCSGTGYGVPSGSASLMWNDIYPGVSTSDCFEVINNGDVPLDVVLSFDVPGGSQPLLDALEFAYQDSIGNGGFGSAAAPNTTTWTDGVSVGTLADGDSTTFRVNARFVDSGDDQSSLQGLTSAPAFTAVIEGRTPGGF